MDLSKTEQVSNEWLAKAQQSSFVRRLQQGMFSTKEQQAFLEDLSSLIDDGVTPNKAVETLCKVSTGHAKKLSESILAAIARGRFLADGMKGWFPVTIVELVRAGEESGTLPQTMHSAATALTQKSSAMTAAVGATSYPAVVLVMGLVVSVFINKKVLTQFATIAPISSWPSNGQHLVAFANFIQSWWWLALILLVAAAIGLWRVLVDYIGGWRDTIDSVPGLSLYRKLTAARFMETMGLLVSNGIVFKKALKILQYNAPAYLAWHLMLMEHRLSRGQLNIADVLDTGLLDDFDVLRLRAIADAHGFEHALIRQGKIGAENGMKTIKVASRIAGGLMLALGSALAAFIITSLYSIGSSLGSGLGQGMGMH